MIRINKAEYLQILKLYPDCVVRTVHAYYLTEDEKCMRKIKLIRKEGIMYGRKNDDSI